VGPFGVRRGAGAADRRPGDAATLRAELREAVAIEDGPTLVRFPTGSLPVDLPAIDRVGGVDVLIRSTDAAVLIVAVGAMAHAAAEVAARLAEHRYGATVVDPREVRPVYPSPRQPSPGLVGCNTWTLPCLSACWRSRWFSSRSSVLVSVRSWMWLA
jgi:hypothetical protein